MYKKIVQARYRCTPSTRPVLQRLQLLGFLMLALLSACVQPTSSAPSVRQDTPEAAVISYFDAVSRGDLLALQMLTDSEDYSDQQAIQGIKAGLDHGIVTEVRNVRLQVIVNDGKMARLRAGGEVTIKLNNKVVKTVQSNDAFTAVNRGGRWILVGLADEFPPGWLATPQAVE